jgi:hypothetical protein
MVKQKYNSIYGITILHIDNFLYLYILSVHYKWQCRRLFDQEKGLAVGGCFVEGGGCFC